MSTKNTVPGPGKPEAYTLDQVKDCLRRSAGVLATTAQKLGCERSAVYGTSGRPSEFLAHFREPQQ